MKDDIIYYDSYKEDRDLILEYNQTSLADASVVNILGMGIDNLNRSQAVVKVIQMIRDGGVHHVISLNPYKLIRFQGNSDLRLVSGMADMHLAEGGGMKWAAKMLRTPLKERVPVLSFMMDLIRIAEIKEFTIFMVGGRPEIAERTFFNIKKSFPKIRIVGRHGGYFSPEREKSVIEAMRKSQANIVFVGLGFPREDYWIHKWKSEFKNVVFIGVGGSFDIISGQKKKAPDFFINRGMEWFYRIITRPWRIGRLIRTVFFVVRIIIKRLFIKA
jgi:N-acetylglucosaminyldiphosphoundecaprenol N-acetyl-beta-D-mannosaminyltransferase